MAGISNGFDLLIPEIWRRFGFERRRAPQYRADKSAAASTRKPRVKHPVAVEIIPPHMLHAMEMKKQELYRPSTNTVSSRHSTRRSAKFHGARLAPGCTNHIDVRKQSTQPVEIALVGKTVALDEVVAPFDAALPPPTDAAIPSSQRRTLTQPTL